MEQPKPVAHLVDSVLDRMDVTDVVFHRLKYSQPLVTEIVARVRGIRPDGRVLLIASNMLLARTLVELGYQVELWQLHKATLTAQLDRLTTRTGSLDKILAKRGRRARFDFVVLPYVLEASRMEPVAVLANLSHCLAPNGCILVCYSRPGSLSARFRGLTGRPQSSRSVEQTPFAFSWQAPHAQRTFGVNEIAGWCGQAGLRISGHADVVDHRSGVIIEPRGLGAWCADELSYLVKVLARPLRDCAIAILSPLRLPEWESGSNPDVTVVAPVESVRQARDLLGNLNVQGRREVGLDAIIVCQPHLEQDVRSLDSQIRFRTLSRVEPFGPAAANAAIQLAAGQVIAFTDGDSHVPPTWIETGLANLEAWTVGVTGHVIGDRHSAKPYLSLPGDRPTEGRPEESERGFFPASNSFYRRDALIEAGGFDETFQSRGRSLWGWDTDVGCRLRRLGYSVEFDPTLIVFRTFRDTAGVGWPVRHFERARQIPRSLRRSPTLGSRFLEHNVFASRATMSFDVLIAGVALTVSGRTPLFLLLILPWIGFAGHYFDLWPPTRWLTSLRTVAGIAIHHLVWSAGLLVGSAQARRLVL